MSDNSEETRVHQAAGPLPPETGLDSSEPPTDETPDAEPEEKRGRSRWILGMLALLLAVCLCMALFGARNLTVGRTGGLLGFLRPATNTPLPTDIPTSTSTSTPTDNPTATSTQTDTPTATATIATPTDTPTLTATRRPTRTPTATQGACEVKNGDHVCDTRCENTDLAPADCTCNLNAVCDPGEGSNCEDCTYAQCGNTCVQNKDCNNPNLVCNNGQCVGPLCPSGNEPGGSCPCRCVLRNSDGVCIKSEDCHKEVCGRGD